MLFCLGEPPVRFLFLCCFSFLMFIFICQCSSFWCCIFIVLLYLHLIFRLLYYVTGTSPVKTSPPALHPTPTTFDCLFFFIYHKHYSFDGAFFTGRRFLPYAPYQHFWHNLLLSRLPWEPAVIP